MKEMLMSTFICYHNDNILEIYIGHNSSEQYQDSGVSCYDVLYTGFMVDYYDVKDLMFDTPKICFYDVFDLGGQPYFFNDAFLLLPKKKKLYKLNVKRLGVNGVLDIKKLQAELDVIKDEGACLAYMELL